jgi:starch synthase
MEVIQAVFGVFHHFELAHQLERRGHLKRIYSTWPWARLKREGLSRELVRTFPLVHTADYLLRRSGWMTPRMDARFNAWNSDSFDGWLRRRMEPCDALIAISGAGLTAGPRAQARGGKFICDRGSTHQRFQDQAMRDEYKRWGVEWVEPAEHIVRREEAIYELADAITVPSQVARRSFVAMGVAAEKVHVIPYGVRLDRFKPDAGLGVGPADSFEVLFAGQISLRKGIPYLLEAFARGAASAQETDAGGGGAGRCAAVVAEAADGTCNLCGHTCAAGVGGADGEEPCTGAGERGGGSGAGAGASDGVRLPGGGDCGDGSGGPVYGWG